MDVLFDMFISAAVANEGQKKEPEHIESGQAGSDEANHPEEKEPVEGLTKDFVLAEEAGERKNSGDSQGGDPESPGGGGDSGPEAAHFLNVLLAGPGVNHAAGAEEQQSFEESVRHEMENASSKSADTERKEHVTKLGDGRIGEDFLNVVLHERHGGGENRSGGTDDGDNVQGERRKLIDRVHADNHVHPSGDHGGGVDQGAHRSRAFHGVREPDIERDLSRFAHRADEEEERDCGENGRPRSQGMGVENSGLQRLENSCGFFSARYGDGREADGAECYGDQQNPEDKSCVADTVDDKGLFTSVGSGFFQEIEPDEQVAAQAHAFPADEHEQHVVGENESQHGKHEQVHVAEEAVIAAFVAHIADRIDVNEEADASDDEHHDAGEWIEQVAPVGDEAHKMPVAQLQRPWREPFEQHFLKDAFVRL